jgi:transposase
MSESSSHIEERLTKLENENKFLFQQLEQERMLNRLLTEEIRLLRMERYGKKAEKLSDAQLQMFDVEPGVLEAEVEQEAELTEEKKKLNAAPRKRTRTLSKLPDNLPREEVIIPCAPEDCHCAKCGGEKSVIDYETTEQLGCKPIEFFVRVTKREKRACSKCKTQGVHTAASPPRIQPKSMLTNELIVDTLLRKYRDHTPIYRQCQSIFQETGLDLPAANLNGPMLHAGWLCGAIVDAMRVDLLQGSYIQADETPVQVIDRSKKGKNHQGYIFEYSHPQGNVIFKYQSGRGRAGPQKFLKEFNGVLQTDGYQVYKDLYPAQIQRMACMAHVRRKFYDAQKLGAQDSLAQEILEMIQELYRLEREAKEKGLSAESRLELREEKSQPLMSELKIKINAAWQKALPKSALGKACEYALGQWSALETYLKNGAVEIDNNRCEQGIRPIALGRKNWMHIGSHDSAPKITAIMSILETCKRHQINTRDYLLDVLPGLEDRPHKDLPNLTPLAWKARQEALPAQ